MFTLKIRWWRCEPDENYAKEHPDANPQFVIADENTLFIAADEVHVGASMTSLSNMKHWEAGSFFDYAVRNVNAKTSDDDILSSRLVELIRDGKSKWYLVTSAWLLGPDGKTIERLTD